MGSSADARGGTVDAQGGVTPQFRGRYPGHDVLSESSHWDAATRRVVRRRMHMPGEIRFFEPHEARALRAFCDLVTAQDAEPRIPVLEMVDAKLAAGSLDGFRYADMPPDPETWQRVAAGLDESARDTGGAIGFADAPVEVQRDIVERFSGGELDWGMPGARAWSVVMRGVLTVFYSHPWAWNEIGFGGPAYPRGYVRLGPGQREPWEAPPEQSPDPVAETRERGG